MKKTYVWKFLRSFANLNFSICILLIIACFCIIGSIIEQDKDLSYYQINYPSYKNFIIFFGIDHIFHNSLFIGFLLVLILSLSICTLSTQLPSLKNARRWKFIYKKNQFQESNFFLTNIHSSEFSYINAAYSLMRLNFFVFYRDSSMYSYKGLYGRIAPVFVHFSIITVLIGSLFSLCFGFVVQEVVPKGEIFHLKNIVHSGFYSRLPSSFMYRVNDFFLDYNFNGSIKQFFSLLSVYSRNNHKSTSKLVSVNNPLRFRSITFYQTDWQINALRINLGFNCIIQQNLLKTVINGKTCWLSTISISENSQVFLILFDLNSNILVCHPDGSVLGKVNIGEKFYINNFSMLIDDVITSTGLQIKIDPGIFIVYFGFFIMILSTFISYLSYSQVWIYATNQSLQLLGSTNRAVLLFERDLHYLEKIYYYYRYDLLNFTVNNKNILL